MKIFTIKGLLPTVYPICSRDQRKPNRPWSIWTHLNEQKLRYQYALSIPFKGPGRADAGLLSVHPGAAPARPQAHTSDPGVWYAKAGPALYFILGVYWVYCTARVHSRLICVLFQVPFEVSLENVSELERCFDPFGGAILESSLLTEWILATLIPWSWSPPSTNTLCLFKLDLIWWFIFLFMYI